MAKYDFPATIRKVLDVTQAQSLAYIGHSQGTEIAFAQLSQTPELARRIRLFVALAPVAYLDGVVSPIRLLAPFAYDLEVRKTPINNNELNGWRKIYLLEVSVARISVCNVTEKLAKHDTHCLPCS